jgi:hypothetical protein
MILKVLFINFVFVLGLTANEINNNNMSTGIHHFFKVNLTYFDPIRPLITLILSFTSFLNRNPNACKYPPSSPSSTFTENIKW